MASVVAPNKPHAVCIPFPAQGHITPMSKLAKLLHLHGFHITFVNTDYNHNRLLASSALSAVDGFQFEVIPDGLPRSKGPEGLQDIPSLCESITHNFSGLFRDIIARLDESGAPPVTCVVVDGVMTFALDVAEELKIPAVLFWTTSACGFMAYLHYQQLVDRGLFPLKDESALTDGYLDMPTDWMPDGMQNMRLRDFPSFIRTTDPDEVIFKYVNREAQRARLASAIIINTFDDLERPVLESMAPMLPPIYTVGPLTLLSLRTIDGQLASIGSNLWKEDDDCVRWLDGKPPRSVVYVNFGSTTYMSNERLVEFAWGLVGSGYDFLWVIRPDLVRGESVILPPELTAEIADRGLLAGWCRQEEVLAHPAVRGFMTHCGWNSMLESICTGAPMMCWPFFAEQQTNCRFACTEWGIGVEVDGGAERGAVEGVIKAVMGGGEGEEIRRRVEEWKTKAINAVEKGGSSSVNFERFVNEVMLQFGQR